MTITKAPRAVYGFTDKASNELIQAVAPSKFNHSVTIESIEEGTATLNIHKFKQGKGKPSKDYRATVQVTSMWGDKIRSFKGYQVV